MMLFWVACLPLRYALYLHAKTKSVALRLFAAVIGSRWVLGFERGTVGFFGGKAWWAKSRPLHGILWLAYATTDRASYLKYDLYLGIANKFLNGM
tara:strand:+ start:2573 stop:2857 length:285 start_codon:yes stop_codon:yes gene_type:complete